MSECPPPKKPGIRQYDPQEFAALHGISAARAHEILRRAGENPEEADRAILRMRQAAQQVDA